MVSPAAAGRTPAARLGSLSATGNVKFTVVK